MTTLLEMAFERAARLSEHEQDEFARLMLSELEAEHRWTELLDSPASQSLLSRLAEDAVRAHRSGETARLNHDML